MRIDQSWESSIKLKVILQEEIDILSQSLAGGVQI